MLFFADLSFPTRRSTLCRRVPREGSQPQGHSFGSLLGVKVWRLCVLGWEAKEEEDEDEDEDEELRRVSMPVLVIFSLRRLAKGALSTLFRKKPSRLPLLKA